MPVSSGNKSDVIKRLLDAYVDIGTVTGACKRAGISRKTFYEWKKNDPDFANAVEDAEQQVIDNLEAEAIKRATSRSDTLLIFLLKSLKPNVYRETVRTEISGGKSEQGKVAEFLKAHPEVTESILDNIEAGLDRK